MILDTNALSALLAADERLLAVLSAEPLAELHLPVIVLGEYRFGLLGSSIRHLVESHLAELEEQHTVLAVDRQTARLYAEVRHELKTGGRPIPENDIWIAALARQHRLPVLSRDAHFDAVAGVRRIAW